ncbi:MAG: hypothetical protein NVS3B10_05400 [Polyangiales bacterium]
MAATILAITTPEPMPNQAPPPPSAAAENPTAIVVSDDVAVRHAIAALLHDASYVTVAVSRFDDAALLLARRVPTAFILDVDLEDHDEAIELLDQMAASPSAPPTLVLSPSEIEDRIATSFGVTVLRKPFEPRTLVAELVRCVEADRRPRPAAGSGAARPA